jgi:hypothetical protein
MRIVLFVVLGLLVVLAGGVAFFPMSMAADMAVRQAPDLKFSSATGSVWDGKLTDVYYGSQKIGDLSVKTELFSLLGGKAAGTLGLTRQGFAGTATISYGIGDGGLDVPDLKISGDTSMVPGMPLAIAQTDGKFTLQMKDVKFANSLCQTASGEVWTDALSKVNYKGWVGPELRGPVTCHDGKLQVQAMGKAPTGEDVLANLNISQHLDMELTATVSNASQGAVEALTGLGFQTEGNTLVLRQAMGSH